VYVGGIGAATEPNLVAAFERVGVHLAHVELVVNRATGCLRGFAFVAISEGFSGLPTGDAIRDAVLARMRLAFVDGRPASVQAVARGTAARR
jgi:hypothetical protein